MIDQGNVGVGFQLLGVEMKREKFFMRRVTYMFGKPSPSALLKRRRKVLIL